MKNEKRTNRRQYLGLLLKQHPDWLRGSMAEPTRYMTRTHILLHAVALRYMRDLGHNTPRTAAHSTID